MDSTLPRAIPEAWLSRMRDELGDLRERSLLRSILTPDTGAEPLIELDGRTYHLFTSNNYLGLAGDTAVVEASVEATRRYGASVSASRLLCGSTPLHEQLESELAALKGQEAALLYTSGYLANLGVLSALTAEGDTVFSDRLNHASIIDGCRLSRARAEIYEHADMAHLESLLAANSRGRRVIVSESVFSMDGDIAPIPGLVDLAMRYDALLVVDEAHATGVLGADGAGALSHFGIQDAPVIVVGTLSKSLGSVGGFVAAGRTVIDYLINRSRPFIFNTALPPSAVGAAIAAVKSVREEPWRRERLNTLAQRLSDGLVGRGFAPTTSQTQIVPLVLGPAEAAVACEARLRSAGVLARAVRPPTVPEGTSRVRFNLMATHSDEAVQSVLAAL